MVDEIRAVRVSKVRKKFCRDLKRSLWYGVQDILSDMNPFRRASIDEEVRLSGSIQLRKDEFWALDELSFELRRGECLGLIGHNGAGKTTLLKLLNGLIKPDHGRIELRGRVGALIALGAGFNPILTGRENIYVNGSVLGMTRREIDESIETIIDFSEIRDFIDAPVQTYSSGMTVRLGFAIAAHSKPDILLLDEVLAVGDIAFQAKCFNKLAQFRAEGTSFILVSHNMHQIVRYADEVLYLRKGRMAFLGEPNRAVELFTHDMMSLGNENEPDATDWSRVYGSGRVVLESAEFINGQSEAVREIKTGDGVTLRIWYQCGAEPVFDPILDLIIRDRDGVLFQSTNAISGHAFGALRGKGSLEVVFDSIPANDMGLLFSFALMDSRTSEIYDWKRNLPLFVRGSSKQLGRISLNCCWKATTHDENHFSSSVCNQA